MDKKAQNLSLNVIIIAALALLVLVILSVIFVGRTGLFVKDSKKCEAYGGVCRDIGEDCPAGTTESPLSSYVCLYAADGTVDENKKCCITGS